MPTIVFKRELEKSLLKSFNKSIYDTGKKVADRFISIYVKEQNDNYTQTDSLDKIYKMYENRIKYQEIRA